MNPIHSLDSFTLCVSKWHHSATVAKWWIRLSLCRANQKVSHVLAISRYEHPCIAFETEQFSVSNCVHYRYEKTAKLKWTSCDKALKDVKVHICSHGIMSKSCSFVATSVGSLENIERLHWQHHHPQTAVAKLSSSARACTLAAYICSIAKASKA